MTHHDIVIDKYGAADILHLRDLEPREPGVDEVAIDVAYSGINFADIQMRLGLYPDAPKKPFVPGYEVSGKVTAVGKNVHDVKPGDHVMAGTYFGGYASHVTLPANQVFKLPSKVDLATAAATPVAFFTAQLAMLEMARVRKGDKVLIECATGGVGAIAIQMCKHMGAEVTGLTTSPHKKDFIRAQGATPYTVEELRSNTSLRGFDAILNSTGGSNITWQRERLGLTGRIVCIGVSSILGDNGKKSYVRIVKTLLATPKISVLKLFDASTGVYALNALTVLRDPEWVTRLTRSFSTIDEMGLAVPVGKVFPARDVGSAHEFLQSKQATGKLVLQW